ncbi:MULTISPECIES: hypothetical protein [Serratia]|uniref:hypothetical protein n=1 Tax=Serratia TaxID=613 RepID=UPI0003676D3D|nr:MULTISPECIES: hypothetical protein [Serratia]MBV6691220.1 hypothetical protein [Serratia quinivorans]
MATGLGIPLTVPVFLQTRFGRLSDFDQHLVHASTDEEAKSISSPQLAPSISRNIARDVREHLCSVYSFFWRLKVRLLLVVGDDDSGHPDTAAARSRLG